MSCSFPLSIELDSITGQIKFIKCFLLSNLPKIKQNEKIKVEDDWP
ncbi:hypothetical protein SAMN05421820_11764 [Pedobacter steynii]|uniref:Uncharacterized protein n=1 Tax=Pedobacter steynii TaxID=430522 RepID=A0A1H0L6Y4_9SPHI|nr:hypothetical protein SAMN05421820_11764 [Pedobacter steynii]